MTLPNGILGVDRDGHQHGKLLSTLACNSILVDKVKSDMKIKGKELFDHIKSRIALRHRRDSNQIRHRQPNERNIYDIS